MYHIKHYGFCDDNYLEHYGVKGRSGRKPRKNRYLREQLDSAKNNYKQWVANNNDGKPINRPTTDNYRHLLNQSQMGGPRNLTNRESEGLDKVRNPRKTSRREYIRSRRKKFRR